MLTKAARLETELKFLKIEQEKAAELKKIQLMKEIATNQAEIEAVTKLDEEHDFDLASNKESLLKSAVSSHERVQAYLQNQIEAEHIPVVMETNLSPPKIDDPAPQVSVPAFNQGNLNPETKPFVPTPPATVQQANNAVSNPTLQPTPTEFDHDPHHNTSNVTTVPRQPTSDAGVLTRLVDLLSQRNNHDSLPRPEPEVFDGNLLRYPTWVKSFKTFIERKTTDPSERLFYLVRFTSGKAREAINGLLPLNTENHMETLSRRKCQNPTKKSIHKKALFLTV